MKVQEAHTTFQMPLLMQFLLGNYSLSRVLPQIYSVNPDPIKSHIMTLVSILANCENSGKLALLSLFGHVAKDNPAVSKNDEIADSIRNF